MQVQKTILWLISSLLLIGNVANAADVYETRADSIYDHMTDVQRLRQLIWISTPSNRTLPLDDQYGGIYYEEPLAVANDHAHNTVAVQLDARMNPVVEDLKELPDMYTLAAVDQKDLLTTYFYFLRVASQERGIDHLVLPDPEDDGSRIAGLLQKMHAFDPDFYLYKSSLFFSYTKDSKKKNELIETYAGNQYWVLRLEEAETMAKPLERYSEKIMLEVDMVDRIKASILAQMQSLPEELTYLRLPDKMAAAISRASVIPLQKESGILPLKRDTVCLITDDPFNELAMMTRKYAYLITDHHGIQKSHAPILIDNTSVVPSGLLTASRTVIFLGEMRNAASFTEIMDAALIYMHPSEQYGYLIPQQLFGTADASGKMPYAQSPLAALGNQPIYGNHSLGYAPAEQYGLDKQALEKIQSILEETIHANCAPGGQLAVAVDGSILINEPFGYLTYDSLVPVDRSTLYDLASVTKVTATLLAVMKLYETGKLDLDQTLGYYLPAYQNTNKQNITIRALLAHNGGLKAYLPFWEQTLSPDFIDAFYYNSEEDKKADRRSYGVKPGPVLTDSLRNWIRQSPLAKYDSVPGYLYSDLGYMILQEVVEKISDQKLDVFVDKNFYEPLGLHRLTFNPLKKGFERYEIAPTEYDYQFRKELVWGEVHDRNAAAFGGVSGHAGLFGTAGDLLVIYQMLLQGGDYGGRQLLQPATIAYFNQRFFPGNGRALGWDKRDERRGNASAWATDISFGHTGFTGTMVWTDPEYDLVFVFLSNRVYPNANNYQLIRRNIRTRIQDVVYESLLAKWIK